VAVTVIRSANGVLTAASLTQSLTRIGPDYEAQHPASKAAFSSPAAHAIGPAESGRESPPRLRR
jgi:hypothetical protein